MTFFQHLPSSVLQAGAIFLSIIIEALPFVLIGSIISGIIEVYITPERVYRFLPKNKFGRIFFGTFIGFIFPSCECGIVPIINRFLEKKVPSYTAVPFLVTAPVINPIVLFATYSAFGNSVKMALYRALGSLLVATVLGIFLGFIQTDSIQKEHRKPVHEHDFSDLSKDQKLFQVLVQAIDEFFDTGRYLVFGCLFASLVQVYVPTRILTSISATPVIAILLLMVLSFLLSLCSEADAFVGSSLLTSFGVAPVLAFLVIGPMLDVKNSPHDEKLPQNPFYLAIYRDCEWSCAPLCLVCGGSTMIRFLILAGYFELTMYLQLSGKLNQYINLHYSYLAYISMFLSFVLALVQLIIWVKQMKIHQSSLWLLGKSGEYFLALYSFVCRAIFPYSDTGFPNSFCQRLPLPGCCWIFQGNPAGRRDNNPVSQTRY